MTITRHMTIERTIHLVMATFALASVSNVTSFFITTEHHPIVATLMALALGTAVATSAIMLTMIDMVKQWPRYVAVGLMVLALVGISGFVQTQNYLSHGLSTAVSATMGFGIVFSGEVLTAIALSLYQAAEKRRKIDDADQGLELKLAETFADTLNAVDTANSVKYLQRHMDKIIKHKADQLVAKYVPVADIEDTANSPQKALKSTNAEPDNEAATAMNQAKRDASILSRRESADQRRSVLLKLLSTEYVGAKIDDLNQSELARQLDTSTRTIKRDIEALRDAGRLNGVVA